jgi:hypothetical protein
MARPEVALGVFELLPMRAWRMFDRFPLFPALLDFAWRNPDVRFGLVGAPWIPEETLLRVIADPETGSGPLLKVLSHRNGVEVRRAARQRLLAEGTPWEKVVEAARDRPAGISLVFADEDDPAPIVALLKTLPDLGPADRVRLYARVAELAGPEPVWAIELERVGALDRMMPAVRASMASGDMEPLARAVEETPLEVAPDAGEDQWWSTPPGGRTPDGIARPAFDGRPDRWLALAGLLRRNRLPPDDEVVVRLMEKVIAAHP